MVMKIVGTFVVVASVLALGWFQFFTVSYRGERILLSYPMFDMDAFENSERKLSRRQAARVEQLLLAARLEAAYADSSAAIAAVHELVVPGYGSRGIARTARNGARVFLSCVEIPETGRDRCFLFMEEGRQFRLSDDVVVDSLVADVEAGSGDPVYRDRTGNELSVVRASR